MSQTIAVFIRQRRNLVLMSCFIIITTLTQANVNELSLLGTKIEIPNENRFLIPIFISLVFLYFVLRYYVYLRETRLVESAWEKCKKIPVNTFGDREWFPHEMSDPSAYSELEWSFPLKYTAYLKYETQHGFHNRRSVKIIDAMIIYVKTLHLFSLKDKAFTEYIVPYLLAGLAAGLFALDIVGYLETPLNSRSDCSH